MIRVTEPLNYFKEPWYIEWVLKEFAKQFKKCADVEKAQKYAMKNLKKIMNEATDIGSKVDGLIKALPLTEFVVGGRMDVAVGNCLTAYNKWLRVYEPKSIVSCERFYAEVEGEQVSGEPDLIVDGVLVDIKCSARISKAHWRQVCAYRALRGESGKVGILRLDKETASYEYIVQDYSEQNFRVWVGLMRAYVDSKGEEDGESDVREGVGEKAVA